MKLNLEVKMLKRFKLMMFMLRILAWLRLIQLETAAKFVCYASRRGWIAKYRVGNKDWQRLEQELEYVMTK